VATDRSQTIVTVSARHARCVADSVSAALAPQGITRSRLEITEHRPSDDSSIVEVEITAIGVDQSTLERVVRQSSPACLTDDSHTVVAPLRPLVRVADTVPAIDVAPATPVGRRQQVEEIVRLVALLLAIFIAVRLVMQTFRVDGPSMTPLLQDGQALIVFRPAYWYTDGTPFEGLLPIQPQGSIHYLFGGPRRGDIVVFRPPGDSNFDSDLVKRIVGLPGDAVAIQGGQVLVNDFILGEPYVQFPSDYVYPGDGLRVFVPDDSYFVLGDNRPASADSHLGWLVPAEKLLGQAVVSYWPPERWGFVPRGDVREIPARPPVR